MKCQHIGCTCEDTPVEKNGRQYCSDHCADAGSTLAAASPRPRERARTTASGSCSGVAADGKAPWATSSATAHRCLQGPNLAKSAHEQPIVSRRPSRASVTSRGSASRTVARTSRGVAFSRCTDPAAWIRVPVVRASSGTTPASSSIRSV
jgi:hypothetical protein